MRLRLELERAEVLPPAVLGALCPVFSGMRRSGVIHDASCLKAKGYGFITPDDGSPRIFFHAKDSDAADIDTLRDGVRVTFCTASTRRGPRASSVKAAVRQENSDTGGAGAGVGTDDKAGSDYGGWLAAAEAHDPLFKDISDNNESAVSRGRQFISRFRAAKMLSDGAAVGGERDPTKHLEAAERFHAAQVERQKSGLESNVGKQRAAGFAAALVSAHERALKQMLDYSGDLTVDKLCEIHATLCVGQGLPAADVGSLRTCAVFVGKKPCCAPSLIRNSLLLLCGSANRLIQNAESVCAEVAACVIMQRLLDIHPFRDGNGRLSRIVCNWVLSRCGVPFVVCLCSTQEQRKRYSESVRWLPNAVPERCDLFRQQSGREQLSQHLSAGVALLMEHTRRAWEELERLRLSLVSQASDSVMAAAVRAARRAQRSDPCMICLETGPNIATLCCGAAVHLNCMAKWLADAEQPACISCREPLPRPMQRPPAPPAHAGAPPAQDDEDEDDTTTTTEDSAGDSSSSHAGDDADQDETTSSMASTSTRSHGDGTDEDGSEDEAAETTTSSDGDGSADDSSRSETDETSDDSGPAPASPPRRRTRCLYCSNVAATACQNQSCGSCCLAFGMYSCARHTC